MQVERTENEIVIRVPATTNLIGLQRMLNYIQFRETASKSQATQERINELAREAKASWWEKNKDRFIR